MTYKEAESKIFDAYFKDQIKPFNNSFCFCGTLSPDFAWRSQHTDKKYPYTVEEYIKMEDALFSQISDCANNIAITEDEIFNGMESALEVLKQIHTGRGETIDVNTRLKKRNLTSKQLVNDL